MGGGIIVLRSLKTKENKKNFKLGQKKIIYDYIIFAKNSFSKIQSINCDRNGFICWAWTKMSKFILLSLRLSRIKFKIVSD